MSSDQDGGSAFPIVHPNGMGVQYYGMSLRDYFAAKAANGLCANPSWLQEVGGDEAVNVVAKASYELADAMLAARNK